MTTQALDYVESVHEQREVNNNLIPEKGGWLELGKFTKIIEKFDTKSRWKCIDRTEKNGYLTIVIERMNYELMEKRKAKIADKIIEKHGELMLASILKCFVKGAHQNRFNIEQFKYKAKNRKKHPERYKKYLQKEKQRKEHRKYMSGFKKRIKNRELELKKMKKKYKGMGGKK